VAVPRAVPFAFLAVVRLVAAGFAAGFAARSLVVAFPVPRGSFGIQSSLERPPAALAPYATAATRGPVAPAASGSARRTRSRASTTSGLNWVPELASSSSVASSSDIAAR